MDASRFQSLMTKARTFAQFEPKRADYWRGYERGLQRAYHGKQFGTEEDHELWMSLLDNVDEARRQMGKGYRAALEEAKDDA